MKLQAAHLAAAVAGELSGPDVVIDGAAIDSRRIRPGQLFVPVVGDRDGHGFIVDALERGAAAYLTSEPAIDGSAIMVEDTVIALQEAGRLARGQMEIPVVGVTGSVGKTSVKDLLAAILGVGFRVWASELSFNNELGVPLTLLGAPADTQVLVVEMGARGVGHVAELCRISFPTIGVVTRVAAAHTAEFGTLEQVARTKAELVSALPADGTAILNAGDERVAAMASRAAARVLTYGERAEVRAAGVELDGGLRPRFRLVTPWGERDVQMAARGLHQVENALAAAAAALVCEVDIDDVVAGLAAATLSPWRMELFTAPGGALVLNDAYNANPTSMAAALRSLVALPAARRCAVLGAMAELGSDSDDEHAAIGELARSLGVRLVTIASPAYGGQDVPDHEAAVAALGPLGPNDAVLVKGSRVGRLERLAAALLEE